MISPLASAPRAAGARYDWSTGRLVVDLVDGCSYAFPPHYLERLQGAAPEALARVEVLGAGERLTWPALGAEYDIPALVNQLFGTGAWLAAAAGRAAGRVRSEAKAAAARANGAKGGRPRRPVTGAA
jgi:hypothetical protein